jgi:hypothetical protein
MTYRPLPSPNKTNFENLWFKIERRPPVRAAYDAAPSGMPSGFDARKFRRAMDFILDQHPDNPLASSIREACDEYLPSGEQEQERSSMAEGKRYGEATEDQEEHEEERRSRLTPAEAEAEDDITESMFGMKNESTVDRRGARDRAMATDAADWFEEAVGRIGFSNNLR